MGRRLGKLLALSWPDRILLAQAASALVVAKAALRIGGLALCNRLSEARAAGTGSSLAVAELERIALAVRRAAAPLGCTCLPQSLAVRWLLRRRGVDSELRFGAKRGAGTVDAHAWVVVGEGAWTFDIAPGAGYVALGGEATR